MYKIGEFSKMSKITIKALRYYEKEGLLKPAFVDHDTNYRYYESTQLVEVSKIISLRQIGLSIKDIKKILIGADFYDILSKRKEIIEKELNNYKLELSKINYLLEKKDMKREVFIKEIPSYVIYYLDGVVKNFSFISEFALKVGTKCAKVNPNLKCCNPDYCYISYLDGEYKEEDIKIRYAQAVENYGIETDDVKFMNIPETFVACIYHKGSYENLRDSYNIILKFIEENDYIITDNARECYIDGCWNKENESDYLTEIQFPVKRK